MATIRALTVDDRVEPWCDITLLEESKRAAFLAAAHVSAALNRLDTPLTGRRGYLVADMTNSEVLIESNMSDMTLSSEGSVASYLRQMTDGLKNIANEDICELESSLKDVDCQYFQAEFSVRKDRKISGASLIFNISMSKGSWLALRVEHAAGLACYEWSLDEASYVLAKACARSIYVGDSRPLFKIDYYRGGEFKPAPSFAEVKGTLTLPDSFFIP